MVGLKRVQHFVHLLIAWILASFSDFRQSGLPVSFADLGLFNTFPFLNRKNISNASREAAVCLGEYLLFLLRLLGVI